MNAAAAAAPVFDDPLLAAIAARGTVKRFPAHTVLITEGDDANALYIIVSGRLRAYASGAAGKEVILGVMGPGEYVGELALDGGKRSVSVVALEPTNCVVVTGATLRQFIVDHPDFAQRLILDLMRRVRALTASVKSLALDDVYSRIVKLVLDLAVSEGAYRVLPQRLTQQDIAKRVGSSREMVSRVFKELVGGGYLRNDAGRIVVLKTPPAAW